MGFQVSQSSYKSAAAPPPISTTITINPGINSSGGPLFGGEQNGYNDGSVSGGPSFAPPYGQGNSVGSVPSTQNVFGAQVESVVFEDGFGNFKIEVVLYGNHPQNFFSSMTYFNTTPALETFTSASATYAVIESGAYTTWQWNALQHYPFGFGGSKVITFNG